MLKTFRVISIVEGISLIALFFIAMPAKYYFDYPDLVPFVGMAHGLLWLLYVVNSLATSHQEHWSIMFWLLILVLSVVPFGFVIADILMKKKAHPAELVNVE